MATADSAPTHRGHATGAARLAIVPVVLLLLIAVGEAVRWSDPEQRAIALTDWLCGLQADWLPFLPWLIAALVFWRARAVPKIAEGLEDEDRRIGWVMAPALAIVSYMISAWTGSVFGDLPPAYHDEFSYLLQAKTFLAGRLSYPSFEPLPELFDQMHVLNEGRFASRYFPGTGLWLAPFVAVGHPYWGQWLAGALATFCVYWIGWEIGGRRTATVVGLLSALSPGLALFSNLLLAHHPTLVGLTIFVWKYLRAQRTGQIRDHVFGALGLTFAMLCRPMTAFGIGVPFGAWLLWQLLRPASGVGGETSTTWQQRVSIIIAWGAPLLCGLAFMLYYNQAVTGDWRVSPYQLYTDTYTPRHVYGFHNVERGEQHLGPKVLENYDKWAEDLTPALAAQNVGRRTIASLRWTLGIVPIVGAVLILCLSPAAWNRGVVLIAAAIVSLHAVHIPYWFEGIMGWHYVFESAPLWLLLVAKATQNWHTVCHLSGCRGRWWGGLLLTAAAVNLVMVPLLWPGRVWVGVSEVAFSRTRYGAFFEAAEQLANEQPTIVFVEADPADRHIDYVINYPSLDGPLLIARYRPDRMKLDEIRALFPDRQAFLFRAAAGEWQRLP